MFEKVLLDQTVAAPIYTATCIIVKIRFFKDLKYVIFDKGTSILEGRTSLGELKSDTKGSFISLYIADCLVFIRCRQSEFQVKIFFRFFLHHLIERELLITNIYFLALANASFRLKNTKYSKDVIFIKKHIFFK